MTIDVDSQRTTDQDDIFLGGTGWSRYETVDGTIGGTVARRLTNPELDWKKGSAVVLFALDLYDILSAGQEILEDRL
jgi:hypothetical protein